MKKPQILILQESWLNFVFYKYYNKSNFLKPKTV